jgi:hypothetical protein
MKVYSKQYPGMFLGTLISTFFDKSDGKHCVFVSSSGKNWSKRGTVQTYYLDEIKIVPPMEKNVKHPSSLRVRR